MQLLSELLTIMERRDENGDTVYNTYSGWRAAAKQMNSAVWFDGDKDICNAMVGPKPYKRGETLGIGEWDGESGYVHATKKKVTEDETPPERTVATVTVELNDARKQLTELQRGGKSDPQAVERVRARIAALQKEIQSMKQEGMTQATA